MFKLLTAVLVICFCLCGAEHFFVTPTEGTDSNCLQPCYTLDQYAQNASLFGGHTNVSLVFLKGIHNLTSNLTVDGAYELVIRGLDSSTSVDDLRTVIDIHKGVRILVSHVTCFELLSISVMRGKVQFGDIPLPSINSTITVSQFQPLVLFSVSNITQSNVYLENIDLSVVTDGNRALSVTITECNYKDSTLHFKCNNAQYGKIKIHTTIFSGSLTLPSILSYYPLPAGLTFYCPSQLQSNTSSLLLEIEDSSFTRWYSGIAFECEQFDHGQFVVTKSLFTQNVHGISVFSSRLSRFDISSTQFMGNGVGVGTDMLRLINLSAYSPFNLTTDRLVATTMINIYTAYQLGDRTSNVTNLTIVDSLLNNNTGCVWIMFWNVQYMSVGNSLVSGLFGIRIGPIRDVIGYLLVENTIFTNNSECGLCFQASTVLEMDIRSSTFMRNQFLGIYILHSTVGSLNLQNDTISQNSHGMIFFIPNEAARLVPNAPLFLTKVTISDTLIAENDFGVTITDFSREASTLNSSVVFNNCLVISNNNNGFGIYNFRGSTLVKDCSFHNNRGTPIIAFLSTIELSGETDFMYNTAIRGGAISLIHSVVKFADSSNIIFMANSALEYGGAIHVVSLRYVGLETFQNILITGEQLGQDFFEVLPCFYQFDANNLADLDINVTFVSNAAYLGGKNIYGASLYDRCADSMGQNLDKSQIDNIFQFVNEAEISTITSDPTRVCFCPGTVNSTATLCNTTKLVHNEVRYPGEEFTIPLVLVGYAFGTLTGTIYARIVTSSVIQLHENQQVQSALYYSCNILKYAVHSRPGMYEIIKLTSQVSSDASFLLSEIYDNQNNVNHPVCENNPQCTARLTTPIYVNITLETCPSGFRLNEKIFTCECDETLNKLRNDDQNVTCEIRDRAGFVTRNGALWVGVDIANTTNTTTSEYLWHKHCLQDYCKNELVPFELIDPDKQCKVNRTGILCGSCVPGFSLPLGSNTCTFCKDNNGLLLLLFFITAGILLVFLIKFLDLTVASGTINGLVFYSNVVWGYNSILLPTPSNKDPLYLILTLPIAWINLDFGIEACFFDGLDSFWKAWLQFLFPLYIWLIAGLIILVSRYSTKATKLFGNNSVAVLATLFLLSYGKLLRNTIIILTPAELHYSNSNTTLTVWAYDGNLQYGNSIHGVLLAAALGVLTFLWLPYTLTLLLVPILKAKSHLKPLHWINTLKPFFDTYYGPHNDKILCQCWTGMLLVVRGVLLVIFAVTSTVIPNANILLLGVISTILLTVSAMSVYKKWYLSLAENLYLLNLIILSCGFLFDPDTKSESGYPVITAVSIAFALFQSAIFIGNHLIQKYLSAASCARKHLDRPANNEVVKLPKKVVEQENQPFDSNRQYRDSILEYVTDSV